MTVESIQNFCRELAAVTEDIQWEDHLCFTVGGKIFFICSPDKFQVTASFKGSIEDFKALTSTEGFLPAPYLAIYHRVAVDDIRRLSNTQWRKYISRSYSLVVTKFPKKRKLELGITS